MSAVVITHHSEPARAIAEALQHIDLEAVARGKRVAIKPNKTLATPDDTTAVTQPDTLRAVNRAIRRAFRVV